MENMIVSTESQSSEVINTNGGGGQEDAGQSDAVQSSENLVPSNVCSAVESTYDASPPTSETNNSIEEPESNEVSAGQGSSKKLTPDHVSSSTEAYSGSVRNNLPSINHQSVVIPNMEPYLEEGSLDGTVKDFQDPSSSNENRDGSSSSKSADNIDSPDQPAEPHCSNKADSGDLRSDREQLPAESTRRDSNISEEQQPDTCPQPDEAAVATDVVHTVNGEAEQQLEQPGNEIPDEEPMESCRGEEEQQVANVEPSQGPLSDNVPPDTVDNSAHELVEPSSPREPQDHLVGSQTEVDSIAEPDSESRAVCEVNEGQDLVTSMTQGDEEAAAQPEEADCTTHQPTDEPVPEEPNQVDSGVPETEAAQTADCVDSSTFSTGNNPMVDAVQSEENSGQVSPQPGISVSEDNTAATTSEDAQVFVQQHSICDEGHVIDSSSLLNNVDPSPPLSTEEANTDMTETAQEDAVEPVIEEASYHQYSAVEPSEPSSAELEGLEPVVPTGLESNSTVCEADSSAVGDSMDESATVVSYNENQEMDTSSHHQHHNVYVVDNGNGHLTLNSVPQTGSVTPFHHSDSSMLVEMAPLSTDGTFVNSQVQYVEAGQEGMITDAQAAELLMRVSEQRPISLQSMQQQNQQGASGSSVPYVQVQLAQTVEGITHLVEVPVSALAGYCLPSTLVYSTSGSSGGGEVATWVMEAPPQSHEESEVDQHSNRTDNKFSDIVSASIEAIGFPESVTPGAGILSQAEQILIQSEQHSSNSASASGAAHFDFDDSSSSSSLTVLSDKGTPTATYPRPKRESIESRIHRLLRGTNAPAPDSNNEESSPSRFNSSSRLPKLVPIHAKPSSPINLNLPKRLSGSIERPNVTIPAVFTATNQSSPNTSALPPGSVDYFMPRGVSKRRAQQTFKSSKVNPNNPNCIDAEPAPPEETQVKLLMSNEAHEDDDPAKDDDEYNRLVLLQARQRQRSSVTNISLCINEEEEETSQPAKRARLSFPPEKYANLETSGLASQTYMTELQTPRLVYTMPKARQMRSKVSKEASNTIDQQPRPDKEINVRLPFMSAEPEEPKRKQRLVLPTAQPRIIRKSDVKKEMKDEEEDAYDIDMESEQAEQVIVIGLDESGQQPSEEQLTAIIQAAMNRREISIPERSVSGANSNVQVRKSPSSNNTLSSSVAVAKTYASKRKVEEENGLNETEENGVRLKVIRTYDRNLGVPRRKPPRSKKLAPYLEIFDFEADDDEEEEEEEVDDLSTFTIALADEEKAIREKEKQLSSNQSKKESPSALNASTSSPSGRGGRGRGRGRGRPPGSSNNSAGLTPTKSLRGRRGGSNIRGGSAKKTAPRSDAGESEDDQMTFDEDNDDDDYKPTRVRGRGGRGRGGTIRGMRSRGRGRGRGRPRKMQEDFNDNDDEIGDEEEEENEMMVPGMPSKPCPQCDERFTTREGFLDHLSTHPSAKCWVENCSWKSPSSSKDNQAQCMKHMVNVHAALIPAAR